MCLIKFSKFASSPVDVYRANYPNDEDLCQSSTYYHKQEMYINIYKYKYVYNRDGIFNN